MNSISSSRRARSVDEWAELVGRVFTPAEIGASLEAFQPRPSDVVIAPYSKCGTTWLQQIFHTLRTRGDMDFDDISRVVPWIETAAALGLDINAEQRADPRGFKSHLAYDAVPRGCRYIVSLRDPKDALVSFYRFMEGWFVEPGAIPVEAFAEAWLGMPPEEDYFHHLASWWAVRDDPNVLLLSYEQMTAYPETVVRRVAVHCGLPLDDALLALTLERSSFAFMLAHKDRYDEAMMRRLSEVRCDLPPDSDAAKVRKGRVGGHLKELPRTVIAAVDELWRQRVTPLTGHTSYAALEADLSRRL
jgi:hypothetical protein